MQNTDLSFKDEIELLLTDMGANRSVEINKLRKQTISTNKIKLIETHDYPIFTQTAEGLEVEDYFYVRQTIPEDVEIGRPLEDSEEDLEGEDSFRKGILMRWETKNPNMKCWKLGVMGGEVCEAE